MKKKEGNIQGNLAVKLPVRSRESCGTGEGWNDNKERSVRLCDSTFHDSNDGGSKVQKLCRFSLLFLCAFDSQTTKNVGYVVRKCREKLKLPPVTSMLLTPFDRFHKQRARESEAVRNLSGVTPRSSEIWKSINFTSGAAQLVFDRKTSEPISSPSLSLSLSLSLFRS